MNKMQKISLFLFVFSFSPLANAQRSADLGLRLNTSDFNKLQLEFRKPFGETWAFRVSASIGDSNPYHSTDVVSASDTLVVTRQKDHFTNHADLRFGFQRNLKWNYFSVYSDLIFSYSNQYHRNWSYLSTPDSMGNWNYSYTGDNTSLYLYSENGASASYKYLGAGLTVGLSFDFPVSEKIIIGINANLIGVARFGIGHKETNDVFNEFNNQSGTYFDYFTNAGIALRYSLGKKQQ